MSQKPDDLEAVRTICTALEPFDESERERIFRWASEKLGIKNVIRQTRQRKIKRQHLQSNTLQLPDKVQERILKRFLTRRIQPQQIN